ncbi:MAG: glycine cleavage system protein GcvH [Planctomycetota bacterium]
MAAPEDRYYLSSHEWHKPDGDHVLVGISKFAVDELTDITYLEVEKDSGEIAAGETFGEVESVKATSELYSGIDGEVVDVNQEVIDNPALLNEDCYDAGWILKIKPSDPEQVKSLLNAADYSAQNND